MNQIAATPPLNNPFSGVMVPVTLPTLLNINNPFMTIGFIISVLLPYIFGLAGMLLLIYLILGGLQLMTSRGDPKAVQMAQSKITSALIGFIIIFLAYAIVSLLGKVLNIPVFGSVFQ